MSFSALVTEDMRLAIIQVLEQDAGYSHNENVIQSVLQRLGHSISNDRLHTELAWLGEQGLVTVNNETGVTVARLTTRGQDAALGRVTVPGVARPKPGAI